MTVITVDHSQGGWKAIPRALMDDSRLSLAARGFMGWILVKPENWAVRPEFCKATFGLSDERWSKLTKELIAAGYYHRQTTRDLKGRVTTRVTITPTGSPPPQKPGPGETDTRSTVYPDSRVCGGPAHLIENLKSKNLINNNNQLVVVFEDDLLKSGLITQKEQDQVLEILYSVHDISDRQRFADELAGALRARGRRGERAIKNPARFLTSLLTVSKDQLTYAIGESELRAARAAAREREVFSTSTQTTFPTAVVCTKPPAHVLKQFDKIRENHRNKNQHVQ
jgi:hypothetical protein